MNYKKDDYNYMAALRRAALIGIAEKLGKEHKITKMMGCMSYGRSDAEQGPGGNLQSAVREMAFLDGCCHILKVYARDYDSKAAKIISDIYPIGYASCPWNRKSHD